VPAHELVSFATRNRDSLGEGFRPPPTLESWACVLGDPTQAWYAIVDHAEAREGSGHAQPAGNTASPIVLGLVVFSRWAGAPWRSAEIGYAVDSELVGRGLIQSAVPRLLATHLHDGLRRIEARVDLSNERAARSLARLGFRREGNARGCLDGSDQRRTQAQWAIITTDLAPTLAASASSDRADVPRDEAFGSGG
jgi:RimJ/RimL family protein N-acetyltransferase